MSSGIEFLGGSKVVPVLVIDDADDAVPLAEALVTNGLPILEVTLRTPAAYDALNQIKKHVPDAVLGVGTVLQLDQFSKSIDCGAEFFVSPGATPKLIERAIQDDLTYLPAAQTISEMMVLRECGFKFQKFFPAALNGGVPRLKAAYSVLDDVVFCPTGGVSPDNASEYLSLQNVACVGGSWLAPRDLVQAKNWAEIGARAAAAAKLG